MGGSFSNIGLAEPSTLTKVVASIIIPRGSTNEHQEILVVGDLLDSLAVARVLAAKPASTEYGQVVRSVETSFNIGSTAADNVITIGAVSGGRLNIGSTAADNVVRAIFSSTSTDNPVTISGNSTVIQGTNPWVVSPNSTAFVKNMGLSVDSSNFLNVKQDANTRLNIGSTAADNAVLATPVSTAWVKLAGFSVDSSNFLNVKQDVNTRLNIGSTAADNAVLATIGTNLQSTSAPSSNSSGIVTRQVIDNILTTASTNAFAASTSLSIQSSGAALRSYVVAYSITSTNAGPHKVKFYSSGTMTWPVQLAAVSSAISGVNLAVSAPAYLFRTNASEALTLQIGSGASTVSGYQVAVSYFRAP